jgi:hypothetical protein
MVMLPSVGQSAVAVPFSIEVWQPDTANTVGKAGRSSTSVPTADWSATNTVNRLPTPCESGVVKQVIEVDVSSLGTRVQTDLQSNNKKQKQ